MPTGHLDEDTDEESDNHRALNNMSLSVGLICVLYPSYQHTYNTPEAFVVLLSISKTFVRLPW